MHSPSPHLSTFGHALYYISKAFTTAASKFEKIGYVDTENESETLEPKGGKEAIDLKEFKHVDHILASLHRKRRRRQEDRPRIHPKNKNSGNRPDFALLASLYPTCSTTATANPESTGLTSMPPANSPASSSFRTTTSIGGSPMVSSALLCPIDPTISIG